MIHWINSYMSGHMMSSCHLLYDINVVTLTPQDNIGCMSVTFRRRWQRAAQSVYKWSSLVTFWR